MYILEFYYTSNKNRLRAWKYDRSLERTEKGMHPGHNHFHFLSNLDIRLTLETYDLLSNVLLIASEQPASNFSELKLAKYGSTLPGPWMFKLDILVWWLG